MDFFTTSRIAAMYDQQVGYKLAERCIMSAQRRKKRYTSIPIALTMDDASRIAKEGRRVTIAEDGVFPNNTKISWEDGIGILTYVGKNLSIIAEFKGGIVSVTEQYSDNGSICMNAYEIRGNQVHVAG